MTTIIDFNNLSRGTVVDNEFSAEGVTISAQGGSGQAMVFDTSNPTGGDDDLATGNLGNVLIISEDGDQNDPDDNARGGQLFFDFDRPSDVQSLTILDVEEAAWIRLFDEDGLLLKQVDVITGNNGQQVVNLNQDGVARIEVVLAGSGAVDNLVFEQPAPEPELDGIVDGTDGNDRIDVNYTGDPEGDRIDNNDALLPGESGNDDIVLAGDGNDTVLGGDGNDEIFGEGGDDRLVAGGGQNLLDGGDGNDALFGGLDNDTIIGGDGDDRVEASQGDDLISGGNGNDDLWAARGDDTVDGGAGNDIIDGGDGNDSLIGGSGNDSIDGGSGQDTILGGDGNDEIFGQGGDDSLVGGADEDLIFAAGGDTVDGGSGGFNANPAQNTDFDTLDLTGQGPFVLEDVTEDGNGNGINGTVVFLDGDGNPTGETIAFTEIEEVLGDQVDPTPDANNDTAETDEDTPVVIDVLANDTDPTNDDLAVSQATSPNGDVTVSPDGTITFTPDENFNGETTITYTVTDPDGNEDTATVAVTVNPVNDGPDAVDDADSTAEDTPITVDLLANDTDPDGDPLTVTNASVPADQGTLVDNGDGTVTFTPAPNFTGEASISYTITDPDGEEDTAVHTITVTPEDDAPIAADDIAETDEDTPVTIDVLGNDEDPDGDPLTVSEASSPNGTVTVNPDGTIEFTPDENFNGETTITYTVTDPDGNEDTATVAVTVNPVNDGPDAVDDADSTAEDTPITVDLLANDTDPDGDPLTVTNASVPADQGTLVDNGDGTVTFTPAPNFTGEATITYTITDPDGEEDTAVHTITVTPEDDAPIAADDIAETDEDTPVTIDVLGNDEDPDGDPLTVSEASSPNGTVTVNPDGTIEFAPDPDFNGDTTITYTVTDPDGNEDTATVAVTVNPVNDGPDAVDDNATTPFNTSVTIPVLGNDVDPDGDPLTVTAATSPDGTVTINPDGTLTFEPNPGFVGPATINYTVSDPDGLTDDAVVTVLVENQPLDGIVEGTDEGDLIDVNFTGDPEGDRVDNNDEILPGEGPNDDIILAGGGDDTVVAGEGDDDVDGGTGDDVITTGDGSDEVDGGEGNDNIDTGNGSFLVDAGYPEQGAFPGFPGEEGTPATENDRDFVDGGAGDDTISTGDDADTIVGGAGEDVIDGGIDDDEIDGGDDDDRIVGGEGNDLIQGGEGDDVIFAGNDPDLGLDFLNIEDDGSNPIGPDLRPDNGRDTVFGGEGNDTIFGADDDDQLFGEDGDDVIDGEIDDDLIDGGVGDDTLIGGQGNDTILGGDDDDDIDGGLDDDELFGDDGADDLSGDDGDDLLDGGEGGDSLDGGTGDDTLLGGAGNDDIEGGTGDDLIEGGDGDDTIDGGDGGNDTLLGGADADVFENVDGGDTVDGGGDGDDFDTLDLTGSAPDNGSLEVTFTGPDSNGNGFDGFVTYFDEDGNEVGERLVFTEIENVIPCFTPGTMIATPRGEMKVEDLKVGDRVITRDNGIQTIRWVGQRAMTGAELETVPHMKPVLIRQGALGMGLPERDMMVSPNHRVLVASDKAELFFEEREVLVAAKHLTGMEGIDVVDVSATTYIHVMFDQHEVILSDGSWTESFQPGDMTLGSMGDEQREEILELFPELRTRVGIEAYTAARRSLKKHEAKLLTQ